MFNKHYFENANNFLKFGAMIDNVRWKKFFSLKFVIQISMRMRILNFDLFGCGCPSFTHIFYVNIFFQIFLNFYILFTLYFQIIYSSVFSIFFHLFVFLWYFFFLHSYIFSNIRIRIFPFCNFVGVNSYEDAPRMRIFVTSLSTYIQIRKLWMQPFSRPNET